MHEEYVVKGNYAIMKCSVPSFVADLITVVSWLDSHGQTYTPNPLNYGKKHFNMENQILYSPDLNMTAMLYLKGHDSNCVILCHVKNIESFFVPIIAAVNQEYMTGASDEYVVSGNFALMKCEIPSFVADLVKVINWQDNNGEMFATNSANSYGTLCWWFFILEIILEIKNALL